MKRSLMMVSLLTLFPGLAGCGSSRTLPGTDFSASLARGFLSTNLKVTYHGADTLEDIELTFAVRFENGAEKTYQAYQAEWKPKQEKTFSIESSSGSAQKIRFSGSAKVGPEKVKIDAQWLNK